MTCKVEGCNRPAHARGYCATHYGQLWRTGGVSTTDIRTCKRQLDPKLLAVHAMQEELRELQASLDEAQICYDRVVGFTERLYWRVEIEVLKLRCATLSRRIEKKLAPDVVEIPIEELLAEEVPDGENAEGRTGA